jgi:hypothetical protein
MRLRVREELKTTDGTKPLNTRSALGAEEIDEGFLQVKKGIYLDQSDIKGLPE